MKKTTAICLIDGEHYLANLKDSLAEIGKDYQVKFLIFIGGTEKIGTPNEVKKALPYPVGFAFGEKGPDLAAMDALLAKHPADVVLDLSDEPIVSYPIRMEIANTVLYHGMIYRGSDFEFLPLDFKKILTKPSLAIWGTGKRIGKTAMGGFIGRILKKAGLDPAIITLSRGGPSIPIVVRGDQFHIDSKYLLGKDAEGFHASSDCFEDALTARVPTFGCRRCGGGMAGKPFVTVVDEGARMAEKAPYVKSVVVEGSGASVAEIKTDKVILLMDATQSLDILGTYMTPLRIRYADLIVLTMCEDFLVTQAKIDKIIKRIREVHPTVRIATSVLRPKPLASIKGKNIYLATTANPEALPTLKKYIEKEFGCRIRGITRNLSDRQKLIKDLKSMGKVDLVLTELKAAAIAIVAKEAHKLGIDTVLLDNIPTLVAKGGDVKNLEKEIMGLLKK
jgi:cyclic 2,3-diphosphoglycerate synthetase